MKTKQMKKRIMSMILALVIGICCMVPGSTGNENRGSIIKECGKEGYIW